MSESNIQASPGSIFICYRREDSADVTGRIYDRLVDHFGPERVFMDVEAIRLGYDFRSEIDQTIKVCSIVIVVIGDEWLVPVDGKRRIDDENDYVRIEIEAALRRKIPIIPVLTRGVSHPTKAMLPASLEALAYRHGTSIRHEHFRGDVDSLISQMDKLLARQESTPSKPAEPKEPTTPVKSTQKTQSQPAIPPVAPISAIAASKAPAVWRRKRLIIVSAVGAIVILLLVIAGFLIGPNRSRKAVDRSVIDIADYQKRADQGDAAAQTILGTSYENGIQGLSKDLGKAAELYQKAADQGYAEAQNNLGLLYERGEGVPKDLGKAADLYQKAADQGNQPAIGNLNRLSKPTKPEVTDRGNAATQFNLGVQYEYGRGVPKDLVKAAELYQKAANQGHARAQLHLGSLYESGLGVPKDLGKAVELYQKAADQGMTPAQNNLGLLYENGQGVPKNLGKARELYQKAADRGYQPAIANLKRLSRPAEPKLTDLGNPTTRRMGQIEEGTRLRGYNLNPNPILVKSADECSKQCEQTDSCLAMTFVKHPKQSGRGDCWLKSAVPPRSSAPPNFASAVKN